MTTHPTRSAYTWHDGSGDYLAIATLDGDRIVIYQHGPSGESYRFEGVRHRAHDLIDPAEFTLADGYAMSSDMGPTPHDVTVWVNGHAYIVQTLDYYLDGVSDWDTGDIVYVITRARGANSYSVTYRDAFVGTGDTMRAAYRVANLHAFARNAPIPFPFPAA